MKISEYIEHLYRIKADHGDLEVDRSCPYGRGSAAIPEVAYRKVLNKRESRPEFWEKYSSNDETNKGEKVVRI